MRAVLRVKSQLLALVGLAVVGIVAVQLVQGALSVTAAATRVAVVAFALTVVDRYVLPLARTLVTTGQRPPS